jgi:hypothetical protein
MSHYIAGQRGVIRLSLVAVLALFDELKIELFEAGDREGCLLYIYCSEPPAVWRPNLATQDHTSSGRPGRRLGSDSEMGARSETLLILVEANVKASGGTSGAATWINKSHPGPLSAPWKLYLIRAQ